jgi:pimeloyl-ACP methyl ester carboxylesterase
VVAYPLDQPLGYAALLPLILAALPEGGPYVLLGESFGGPLALRAAVAAPNPPRAVVLSASFIDNPSWVWPEFLEAIAPIARWIPQSWRSRVILGRRSDPALEGLLREILGQVPPDVLHERLMEVLRVDAGRDLAECPCPVLYLRGRKDWIVPWSRVLSIRSVRPDVQVAFLPTGHLVLQCAPGESLQAIAAFLGLPEA